MSQQAALPPAMCLVSQNTLLSGVRRATPADLQGARSDADTLRPLPSELAHVFRDPFRLKTLATARGNVEVSLALERFGECALSIPNHLHFDRRKHVQPGVDLCALGLPDQPGG